MVNAPQSKIEKSLINYRKIAVDTAVFIYHFEAHPDYASATEVIFRLVETGKLVCVTSTITLMEILVKPKQLTEDKAVEEYKFLLLTFPNLTVKAVNIDIAEKAAELRAKYKFIRPPDAIQIGTGIVEGANAFITNDEKLKQIKEVKVITLNELLKL